MKKIYLLNFSTNIIALIFGIGYICWPNSSIVGQMLGIFLLASFILNLGTVYVSNKNIKKNSALGNRIIWMGYLFLVCLIISMLCSAFGNFLINSTYETQQDFIIILTVFVYLSLFSTIGSGLVLNLLLYQYYQGEKLQTTGGSTENIQPIQEVQSKNPIRFIAIIFMGLIFIFGLISAFLVLFNLSLQSLSIPNATTVNFGLFYIMIPMWGGLWSFTILAATLFLLKLIRRYHRFRLNSAVGIIGVIISAILFLPMIVTPSTIPSMNSNFASAFGSDWETQIPSEIQQQHFLTTRFNVGAYYFGMSPKPCNIIKDISFYNGTSGVDDGIRLYFDAYLPLNNGIGLPGANSTLIRIHGGGWAIGDKGTGNMLQMNEYFASQGYCVFDIQYGITTQLNFMESMRNLITPANVMGNFTIADMIRHIGIFCQYLTAHATEYGANLNSTFISGGSAGGHLTCAAGLAIASGNYTSWFGDKINLRGIVPFYPANREATFDKITPQELIDPSLLITDQSPACLIFQGLSDGLVVPHLAQDFKDAYTTANNPRCAVIWMPFSSHGSDLDFSGYYNQIFLYYMERFLYLYR